MANIFFTSDHHFGHGNIIRFTGRPFASAREMDESLIRIWNRLVGPNDTVFHLGDFTLGNDAQRYMGRLNGKLAMVTTKWHHDRRWMKKQGGKELKTANGSKVIFYDGLYVLKMDGMKMVMCHFPFEEWDSKHYGSVHLHGHSHGKLRYMENRIDVGIDKHLSYAPFSLEEIKGLVRK